MARRREKQLKLPSDLGTTDPALLERLQAMLDLVATLREAEARIATLAACGRLGTARSAATLRRS